MKLTDLDIPVFKTHCPVSTPADRPKVQQKPNKGANKPIPKMSAKRAKETKAYLLMRQKFLKERVFCQIKRAECSGKSTDVHHLHDGADRQKYYLDKTTWIAVCRHCHKWVHNYPQAAKTLGFLK
jgi:hypothetical protein